jgi:hypothetical protein
MQKSDLTRRETPKVIEADAVPIERRAPRKRAAEDDEVTGFAPWVWLLIIALASFKVALAAILFVIFVLKYPKFIFGGIGTLFARANRQALDILSTGDDGTPRR